MLHKLVNTKNSKKTRKRIGRGTGSGMGKTATKGHKGQKARAGASKRRRIGFEGGQMPLYRRLPKVGFKSSAKDDLFVLTLRTIINSKAIDKTQTINLGALMKAGVAQKSIKRLKVIGDHEINQKIDLEINMVSKGAKSLIEKAGGSVKVL